MRVSVTLEQRFFATPDGRVWTSASFPYTFWSRYLAVFSEVRILARVAHVNRPNPDWKRTDGPSVSVAILPYYLGPFEFLQKWCAVRHELRRLVDRNCAVILRAPSPIGMIAAAHLREYAHPYGVEVLGDPWDVFAPAAVAHPLRGFFRWAGYRDLRRLVRDSVGVAYVTERTLQRRYPADKRVIATHYSDVELRQDAFVSCPRARRPSEAKCIRLISVGSLEQMYKAPDVAISAVAQCVKEKVDVELVWVGDGKHRPEVETLARGTNCPERFHFTGNLAGPECVRTELDKADVFLLASRTEGLPRAMIEAMARGLPCIGSSVGGIPELLPEECLVPPNDSRALAAKITQLVRDPKKMEALSVRNLRKAEEYREEVLSGRRTEFYARVREATEQYLKVGAYRRASTPPD